jgi:hypothetical protein
VIIINKLKEISKLKDNWDGYGAKIIPKKVIRKAKQILKKSNFDFMIFPTGRESIQLELENKYEYFEIEIFKNKIHLYNSFYNNTYTQFNGDIDMYSLMCILESKVKL